MNRFLIHFLMLLVFTVHLLLPLRIGYADEPFQFNRDVRPILSDRCYACHGPDKHSREADLRLDQRASALGSHEEGAAIVPGKPELSELVARISSDDRDVVMPPPKLNKPLTPAEKQILVRWISEGAKYERHWAFTPPRREALPAIRQKDWPRNAIDPFILARLEAANFSPSPAAKRETLIRRVTTDLTEPARVVTELLT